MTYFQFLLLFLVPPILVLYILARPGRRHWSAIGILGIVTYVWTTPWDNYLVGSGVWAYPPEQVTGLKLGFVPIEEYTFFGLQAILGSLWTLSLQRLTATPDRAFAQRGLGLMALAWAIGPGLALALFSSAIGAGNPVVTTQEWPRLPFGQLNYLVLILAWALPVIVGQWVIGRFVFTRPIWVWALGWAVPALYLSLCDSFAISAGIWHILPDQSLSLLLPIGQAGLPFEEALFFIVSSVLVTQGYLLISAPEAGATVRGWLQQARRGRVRA
ncbi:MAG TPA: lycopene cyclase domain-containing protein [Anaerolineales bacterium]|nr:lycopene cyclase domain-containing protein [Anaerolineales bacterium]HRF50976.1 lycopene cyclase domain-containing protein [Anaerolineales bacterium]